MCVTLPCSSMRICAHCAPATQGEDQKKLDVLANEVFINLLSKCGQCAVLVRRQGGPLLFLGLHCFHLHSGSTHDRICTRFLRRTTSPPSSTRRGAETTAWCSTPWCGTPQALARMSPVTKCRRLSAVTCTGRLVKHRLRRVHRYHLWHLQTRGGVRCQRGLRAAGAPRLAGRTACPALPGGLPCRSRTSVKQLACKQPA